MHEQGRRGVRTFAALAAVCVLSIATPVSAQASPADDTVRNSPRGQARQILAAGASLWAASYATSIGLSFALMESPHFEPIPIVGAFVSGSRMVPGCEASSSSQCPLFMPFGIARIGLGVAQVVGATMTVFSLVSLSSIPSHRRAATSHNRVAFEWSVVPGVASARDAHGMTIVGVF